MSTHHTPGRPPYAGTRAPRLAESDAFNAHMARGWGAPDVVVPVIPGAPEAAADHRRRLSERIGARDAVVGAGRAPLRNGDAMYGFRADSDFVWLTGVQAEDGVLVLRAADGGHDATLYLPPPAKPGESAFFGNAAYGELWVGPSPDLAAWAEAFGIAVEPRAALDGVLEKLDGALASPSVDEDLVRRFGLKPSEDLVRALSDLRMIKDDWEIGQLREAIDHTVTGFDAVAREVPRAVGGLGERWLQGTFDRHARTFGNGPGYSTIVGSGPHAPTLHWVRCDGPILPDMPLLLDMGVEANSLYTADVTRTIPPSGTFSPIQRQVHDLVEKSHRAGMAQIRPGVEYLDFHFAAMEVIAQGLHDWGLLDVSVDEALSPGGQQHRRWLVCGIGHHLGLDVHDCAHSDYQAYQAAPLAPGVVMTVEPGLYFHAHDETVPPELRGIGVRLEDDLLVTADGAEVLSDALPIDAAGIERWTAERIGDA
ncbi:aminopeptidase P family protein [Promicromonospora sukumoe]|uniref:aminopeptidase P family protein n=1 Tax=Promicromonospora sukumoe TaxID=88382 RepID=UPI0003747D99|nr:aminopeptidase P family protein [Promicromonospora sukumoe]